MRCRRTAVLRAVLPAALCLALATRAAADVIHYKDGRTVEGRIVERTATEVVVETEFGKLRVPLAKIDHIEAKETLPEEFARRRAALKADDVAGLFELAVWARDHALKDEVRPLLLAVLAANPNHALANDMLGRTHLDGRWFEPAELDAYVRSVEAAKRAEGLLFDQGSWRPEAEVMARRGFKLWKGEWKPRRQAETAADIEDLATLVQVKASATSGEFVTLFSDLPEEDAALLIAPLDNIVSDLLERLQPLPAERDVMLRYDVPVFLLPDDESVARFMDSGFVVRFSPVLGFEERFRGSGGFSMYWPRPLIGLRLLGVDGGPRDELQRLGILSHQLVHVVVQRFKGVLPCPGWLEGGLAALYEGLVTGDGNTTLTSYHRDRNGDPQDPFVPGWADYGEWQAHLADSEQLASVGPLATIMERPIDELDSRDIGVCWSVVRFMLQQHAAELVAYLRHYAEHPDGQPHEPAELHARAWGLAFSAPLDAVEAEWRTWAASQPRVLEPERLTR